MLKSELLNQFGSFGHELSSLHAAASSAGGHSASGALSSSLDRSSQLEQLLGSKLLEISQLQSRVSELEGNLQEQQQQQSQANEIKRLQVHIVWLEEQSKLSEQLQVSSTTRLQAENEKLKASNQKLQRQASELRLPLQQLLQNLQDSASLAGRLAAADAPAGSAEQLLDGRSLLLLQQPAAELHSLLCEQVDKLKRVLSAAAAAGAGGGESAAAAAAERPASAAPDLCSQSWSFDREHQQQLSPSTRAR
jgi:chromosome segregation ATPase